ncbi:hypothetical protein T492DRAFT_586303, partial [Pavlovales sp. CCMP2436]
NEKIKLAQLSGYISEINSYHHGEASLQQAIIGMAQNYVGAVTHSTSPFSLASISAVFPSNASRDQLMDLKWVLYQKLILYIFCRNIAKQFRELHTLEFSISILKCNR